MDCSIDGDAEGELLSDEGSESEFEVESGRTSPDAVDPEKRPVAYGCCTIVPVFGASCGSSGIMSKEGTEPLPAARREPEPR